MRALKRDGIALAVFSVLTCVMTNPLVFHLANAVEDKQDPLLNTWIIAWVGHALITDPLHLFNANIFYPYPNTLALSETLLPQGLFALPFNLALNNTILGYNLVLLFSFFLAAYAMYLFVLDLTRSRGAAIVAGTIFAFNPYNLGNLAQVQLLSFGWLPLALLFLRRILQGKETRDRTTEHRQPDNGRASAWQLLRERLGQIVTRNAFLFALFFSLQTLSSFYFALFAGIAVGLAICWAGLRNIRRTSLLATAPPRPQKCWGSETASVAQNLSLQLRTNSANLSYIALQLVFSAILIAVMVVPFLQPYLDMQRTLGLERPLADSEPFSASLKLYTEVSPQNVLYGNLLAPRPPIVIGGYPLDNLFPGLVAVALAIVGMAASKNRERWFYALLLAVAFVFSLGPRLFLSPTAGTPVTLPYRWLYAIFPLLHALRAPVRFDVLVMLAVAVLAGMGVERIAGRKQYPVTSEQYPVTQSPNHPITQHWSLVTGHWLLSTVLVLLVSLEYLAVPEANITPVPVGDAIPQYVHWLARQPLTTILELPMIKTENVTQLDLTPQYFSTYHWQRIPDGYSGFNPRGRGGIAYEMQFFPDERSISLLQALGVEYVVVHSDQIPDLPKLANAIIHTIEHTPDLRSVQSFGGDWVYRITPRAQDASALSASVYLPQPAAPNDNYWAYLIVRNRSDRSVAVKPTDALKVAARWNDGTPDSKLAANVQQVVVSLPLVTSSVSVVPVHLTAPSKEGKYHLSLQVSGDVTGLWEIDSDVSVENGDPAHEVVLPARVSLNSSLKPTYAPGEIIKVPITWQPLNKIDAYYSASVRIVDAKGNKIQNSDHEPDPKTLLWTPGVAVPDHFQVTLPKDLTPGQYSVQVKMYQADLNEDALLLDENDVPHVAIVLGTFTVK